MALAVECIQRLVLFPEPNETKKISHGRTTELINFESCGTKSYHYPSMEQAICQSHRNFRRSHT
jgi:hypothetical protein